MFTKCNKSGKRVKVRKKHKETLTDINNTSEGYDLDEPNKEYCNIKTEDCRCRSTKQKLLRDPVLSDNFFDLEKNDTFENNYTYKERKKPLESVSDKLEQEIASILDDNFLDVKDTPKSNAVKPDYAQNEETRKSVACCTSKQMIDISKIECDCSQYEEPRKANYINNPEKKKNCKCYTYKMEPQSDISEYENEVTITKDTENMSYYLPEEPNINTCPKYVQAFRKPRPLAIREIYDVPYPTVYRAIVIETDDFCMEDTGELLRLTDCKKSKCSLQ